jgi:hypothetical protein
MTTLEMINQFNTLKDFYQAPYYDNDDIILFLNRAIESRVDSYYPRENEPTLEGSFGQSQRSLDGIHTLIKSTTTGLNAGGTEFHKRAKAYVELPEDYRHFETIEIDFPPYPKKITVKGFDEINQVFADPFSTPNNSSNVYLVWHAGKILIFSQTVPAEINLIYCKNPEIISLSQDCDLPILEHRNVVEIAVKMAIGIAEETDRAKLTPLIK